MRLFFCQQKVTASGGVDFLHRQADATLAVDFQHLDAYHIADRNNVAGVFDECSVEFRNMDQPVLVNAYVDEGTKTRHDSFWRSRNRDPT